MTIAGSRCMLLACAVSLVGAPLTAQSAARLSLLPESQVRVDGTSNKSDWSVKAGAVSGYVVLQGASGSLEVGQGGFTVQSRSLVSEHGVIMDRLMHNALRSAEHPEIVYELVSATVQPAGAGQFTLATRGRVTIAGVTHEVEQTVQAERRADGTLRFTGSQPIDMADYRITPPTAMFGALRTGRRVVVHFDLVVRP